MSVNVHALFPTPVMQTNIKYMLNEGEVEYISSIPNDKFSDNGTLQDGNHYVLDQSCFAGLKQLLQKELTRYAKEVYNYECDVYITHSWVNINPPKSSHFSHTHVNSVFSGVFYIQVPEGCSGLTFFKDKKSIFQVTPSSFNDFNSGAWTIDVNEGDVIIFPSDVYHEVQPNNTDTARISLAFNSFIRGSIGDKEKSNYIELL